MSILRSVANFLKKFFFCKLQTFCSDNDAAFDLEWLGKIIRLRSSNGKYVSVKASGHLVAAGNEPEDFVMGLTNRYLNFVNDTASLKFF